MHHVFRAATRCFRRRTLLTIGAVSILGAGSAEAATLATGDPATALDLKLFANGLSEPTDITVLPDGRAVITERLGRVVVRKLDGTLTDAAKIPVVIGAAGERGQPEQGLLGIVADPDFANNKTLYIYVSINADTKNRHQVQKITLGDDNLLGAVRTPLIEKGLEGPANHNGGALVIHKDADGITRLYIGVGDTGHNANIPKNRYGSCLNHANGKILRINLDGTIPTDNPLQNVAMVTACDSQEVAYTMAAPDPRIFAWGLRNPFRFWIDDMTHKLWIGDVGEVTEEEITVGGKGQHFGYPFVEGAHEYTQTEQSWRPATTCMGMTPATACTPPVYSYHHDGTPNVAELGKAPNCVIGGAIPSGCGWSAPWNSRYIFGDHGTGRIVSLDVNAARDGVTGGPKPFADAGTGGLSSIRSINGAVYIVQDIAGRVDQINPKGAADCTATDAGAVTGPDGSGGAGGSASPSPEASVGSGGAGGAASGTGGSGGSTGAGATSGSAGIGGASTTAGSGGSDGSGGASSPAGGSGGTSNTAGTAGAAAGTSGGSSSCSCSTKTMGRAGGVAGLAALSVLGTAWVRRSRTRKRGNRVS
jgi:glucose/arabinose dehydrogenase